MAFMLYSSFLSIFAVLLNWDFVSRNTARNKIAYLCMETHCWDLSQNVREY